MTAERDDFFQYMKDHGIPLLYHVGAESLIPSAGQNEDLQLLNNRLNLERELKSRQKVIAAHCAMPVWPKNL